MNMSLVTFMINKAPPIHVHVATPLGNFMYFIVASKVSQVDLAIEPKMNMEHYTMQRQIVLIKWI